MKCCGTGLWRYCEASEQDSNIVYGFHLIPIYNRAQFVDKTDPCCSVHAGRGGVDRCRHGMPSGYNARDPFSGFCWRYACLPVLTMGMQRPGDAVTSILPAGIRLGRESAPQVRAVKGRPQGNPTPGRRRALSVSVMVLCSVQMGIMRLHAVRRYFGAPWWRSRSVPG